MLGAVIFDKVEVKIEKMSTYVILEKRVLDRYCLTNSANEAFQVLPFTSSALPCAEACGVSRTRRSLKSLDEIVRYHVRATS
jgi:hypothetical protein